MINPVAIKQRKIFLDNYSYTRPTRNLSLLEESARKGNMADLEYYISEWTSYNLDNSVCLNNVLNIIDEFSSNNISDSSKIKIKYLIESTIIPKVFDSKNQMYKILEFVNNHDLNSISIYAKINECMTYDRIIRNQKVIDENCDMDQDPEPLIYDICNTLLESPLDNNDKYTVALENSIYSLYLLQSQRLVNEEVNDINNIVDLFFTISLSESFDYNTINFINENDILGTFDGVIVGGILGTSFAISADDKTIISKLNKQKLREYERTNSLYPYDEFDYETANQLTTFVHNEKQHDIVKENFNRIKINGKTHVFLSLYTDNGLSRILCIYKNKNDIILVPVYATIMSGNIRPIRIVRNIPYDESSYVNESNRVKKMIKDTHKSNNDIIENIKKEISKNGEITASKLKSFVTKFFTRSEQSIIDDLPDLFTNIRVVIVATTFAINPYIGILNFIAMKIIKLHVSRKQRDSIIKKYDNEISKTKRKIENCKSDKTKEKLEKYLKELQENKGTIDAYYDKYFTSDEIDDRLSDNDDFDIDFEDDFNLDESGEIVLNELSITSKLKLAQQNFKKAILKMSDKEKTLSNQMDHAYDKFVYQFEKAMSNKNREAVIKGSVIPSLSSLIKLACIAGTISFVSPCLAAITVIGGFAASKKATQNERKYILDEIDIQLKVVKKKLDLAETNNDMKTYEQLLKIERQLESERNRIVYKKRRPVIATSYNNK